MFLLHFNTQGWCSVRARKVSEMVSGPISLSLTLPATEAVKGYATTQVLNTLRGIGTPECKPGPLGWRPAIVVAQVIPPHFPVDVHDLIVFVELENLGKILSRQKKRPRKQF